MVRSFYRSPTAITGTLVLGAILVLAIVGPLVFSKSANALHVLDLNQGPSRAHWLGTDQLGRDIFRMVLVAARLSLWPAAAAVALSALVGIPAGASVAFLGRRARSVLMRLLDTLLAFPPILVAIFLVVLLGAGPWSAAVAIGVALSFRLMRVVAGLAMSIGGREYMAAATILGVPRRRILTRYVIPNLAETLIVMLSNYMSASIVAIAGLSFLGLGIRQPAYDWGGMLTTGVQSLYINPAAAIGPAFAIGLSALAFGLVGEALAKIANPVLRRSDGTKRADAARSSEQSREGGPPAVETPSSAGGDVQLDVRDLTVRFPGPRGFVTVVDGVSFAVRRGERIGIVGESGSGKTMTALGIARLVPHPGSVGGSVVFAGEELGTLTVAEERRLLGLGLGFVFQDPMSSLNPAVTIGAQLREPAQVHRKLPRRDAAAEAVAHLRETRVPAPESQIRRYPHELSGGMRQRVMIAMSLMNEPALVIADEPTTALDVTIQAQIMEILQNVSEVRGTSLLFISHNLGVVSQHCDRVLVMYAGRIVEDLTSDQLVEGPRHPYTRALMAVVPGITPRTNGHLPTIPGQAPDLAELPPGCPFHPRCPLADERCQSERPPLVALRDGGRAACWHAEDAVVNA